MDAVARFIELVQGPDHALALDEALLCIAAHAHPGLDPIEQLARLDDLAARCPAPTFERLLRFLFVEEGFGGNRDDYGDPRNSFLPDVLDRRLGIPITLSALAIEVGRRIGVEVRGVGMPGHFLVRSGTVLADPFDRGRILTVGEAASLCRSVTGSPSFDLAWLDPVDHRTLLLRVLANLKAVYLGRGDAVSLAWVLRLRVAVPGSPPSERAELARLMSRFN